ncbi:MAG: hydantoinase [Planctomycetota bacterium]|nr:MAG: hydantoinase [Planctomycetota bacterium]
MGWIPSSLVRRRAVEYLRHKAGRGVLRRNAECRVGCRSEAGAVARGSLCRMRPHRCRARHPRRLIVRERFRRGRPIGQRRTGDSPPAMVAPSAGTSPWTLRRMGLAQTAGSAAGTQCTVTEVRVWEFWIDVGGTFTDCVARGPDGSLRIEKVLSSAVTKGRGRLDASGTRLTDAKRIGDGDRFWDGAPIRLRLGGADAEWHAATVTRFESEAGRFHLAPAVPRDFTGAVDRARWATPRTEGAGDGDRDGWPAGPLVDYELCPPIEAPVLAIRRILRCPLSDPVPPCVVKLGTTRGTNALLTRTGARTAFVTNEGLGDVLRIGYQDRPRLFDLAIRKPRPLFEQSVEIPGRLDARGVDIEPLDRDAVRRRLAGLREAGVESLAVCLMHAYANDAHERAVKEEAQALGFRDVSISSEVTPAIKIVSRGDTTVVDAYLNPVLRDYVMELQQQLPGCRLKLMTSSGGLVDGARFTGKDSLFSGPAGGVIGFSKIAARAGFPQSIGFDMGGTSTDVARFDGSYEMEYETTKAGVRIVAPMLAIETVAAGGGSICGFDGVKLSVGPQSAGASPGPACYGGGGPLTVTDVNVWLGRILPEAFPFPLDLQAIEKRLTDLCERVARSPLGRRYQPIELAEGFRRIANINMARAIRNISVAKGYDPREYVLVCFGGAGGQHACALARELQMPRILFHPAAGVLSALGIGCADVRRLGQRAILSPLSVQVYEQIGRVFDELERRLVQEVLDEGMAAAGLAPTRCQLDLRYAGQDAFLTIDVPEQWRPRGDGPARQAAGSSERNAAAGVRAAPAADGSPAVPSGRDVGWICRQVAEAFHREHQRRYGYTYPDRPIEVVNARVEVVASTPAPAEPERPVVPRTPRPSRFIQAHFEGRSVRMGVFWRDDLQPGDRLIGPAMVCEATSTTVIDPGFVGEVNSRGEIVVINTLVVKDVAGSSVVRFAETNRERVTVGSPTSSAPVVPAARGTRESDVSGDAGAADPVLLEVFYNQFASIAEQMGITLRNTAISTNVKERLDFSCAIFDPDGNLVVNAPHIPVHLGAMSETVRCVLRDNPDLGLGDVFVTNDPFRGGSHLPDITVVTPVHGDDEQLLFWTASRAHHAEIGGIVPGSMPPFSVNLAEEGVLIRNFRLVHRGRSRLHELGELLRSGPYPSRAVRDNLADIEAQAAANRRGALQLLELIDRHGVGTVQAYMRHIQRAASEKMRLALTALPDGTYRFVDHLDDGARIAVAITIRGDRARVDFTGTDPPLGPRPSPPLESGTGSAAGKHGRGGPAASRPVGLNLNANRAITTAAVLYVFRCMIGEDIPLNSGVLEPVEIVLPECLLNPPGDEDPSRCPAMVGGNVETSQRIVDVLLGALGLAAASQGTMNNLTFGDATFGYYETICGGAGATRDHPGADAVHTHMTNTRLTDPEVLEHRFPVRVRRFAIRRGSGGRGRQPGGCGVVRELQFLKPVRAAILSERRGPYPPFGLDGGRPGAVGRNAIVRAGEPVPEELPAKCEIEVRPGDVLVIETPGGGGYGPPAPTGPSVVAKDPPS